MDENQLGLIALRAWKTREGALVNLMLFLGDELELFGSLPVNESFTVATIGERTGFDGRWLEEWLRCMAAADFLASDDGEHFVFSEEAATILADHTHPMFAGGAMKAPLAPAHVAAIANAIRTGRGFTYGELGADMARSVEAGFAPRERALLVSDVVPAIPGLVEQLERGATLLDIGCGTGHTLEVLAEAFPAGTFVGYDPSEPASSIARERFAGNDRVTIHTAGGEDLAAAAEFDVAFTFDCLHDMPRPDLTLAAVRRALRPDGVLVVKEIRSTGDFTLDRKNPVHAMMYGASMTTCLASATSTPDGLGLGTLGLDPSSLEALCTAAGFATVTMHDVGDPVNLFYEVRP